MRTNTFFTGALLGAGAMYFFDPKMGRRRRVLLADQLHRLSRQASCAIDAGMRDLNNRAHGAVHDMGALVGGSRGGEQQISSRPASARYLKWSPGSRLVAGSTGAALMARRAVCRTPGASLMGLLGAGMFTQALSPRNGEVQIERTIGIQAPVDRVYDFFSHPENYLRISDVVTNVEVFGDGRFAKDMLIAGIPVHFEERFTRMEKDCLIQTHSEPSSFVRYCKQMAFEKSGKDATCVHLRFTYHPPGGVMGHAFATMLGIDPKSLLVDLMMRAKYFLESGREPHDAFARRQRMSAGNGNGKGKQRHEGRQESHQESQLHGPGAPADDVHVGSMVGAGTAPWPASRSNTPQFGETSGPFPLD